MTMATKKLIISGVLSLAVSFSVAVGANNSNIPALKDAFKDDFLVGAALSQMQISGEEPNAIVLVEKHFNSVTAENVMKWSPIHPEPNKYDFEAADRLVEFGEKNKMFIIGHTLVWQQQTPRWVFQDPNGVIADRETILARMKDHIFTVVGRYKGRVGGWDVVNEAIDNEGQFRTNRWYNIIGEEYVAKAFEYAHEADPNAELYYNDFDMWKIGQVQGVIKLVKGLQAKGLRIDGIGMQGHWGLDYPPLDELEAAIIAFSELGVKLMVTELDISILPNPFDNTGADISKMAESRREMNPYVDGLPDEARQQHDQRYADIFAVFHKHRDKFSRVTFWGVHDGHSWRNYWPIRGRIDYPLLFDRQYQPKSTFFAVIKTVQK